jgi:hypothetical protein
MRSRHIARHVAVTALVSMVSLAGSAGAQSTDPLAGGLIPGDYIRVSAGVTTPVNPQGSLKDWKAGTGFGLAWENWQAGGTGVGRVGFGISGAYSFLPFDGDEFKRETNGIITSAEAKKAGILEIVSSARIRFPAPVVSPAILIGFGFIHWAPGKITYTDATSHTTTATQQHRSGAELSIGASLDRQLWDRYAAYVEGTYVYGYTSYGTSFTTPGGVCTSAGCDPLKNTTIATLRGGLRVRFTK